MTTWEPTCESAVRPCVAYTHARDDHRLIALHTRRDRERPPLLRGRRATRLHRHLGLAVRRGRPWRSRLHQLGSRPSPLRQRCGTSLGAQQRLDLLSAHQAVVSQAAAGPRSAERVPSGGWAPAEDTD